MQASPTERIRGHAEATQRVGSIRLDEILGEGTMGTVWAGFDEKLRRDVAVKTVRDDRVSVETRARLLTEARVLSRLAVPGICRVYDYVEDEDAGYLVMERLYGRPLTDLIAERPGEKVVLRLAEQLAQALAAAHGRGVIHRDLKPANIMLTREDESAEERIKVLDFGLAARSSKDGGPETGTHETIDPQQAGFDGALSRIASLLVRQDEGRITGTPAYMSPEQARGEPASAASDMYSYALVLQELLTGRSAYPAKLPFDQLLLQAAAGNTLPAEGVNTELRHLLEDLKAQEPEERPTAGETVARLQRIKDRPRRLRRIFTVAALLLVRRPRRGEVHDRPTSRAHTSDRRG